MTLDGQTVGMGGSYKVPFPGSELVFSLTWGRQGVMAQECHSVTVTPNLEGLGEPFYWGSYTFLESFVKDSFKGARIVSEELKHSIKTWSISPTSAISVCILDVWILSCHSTTLIVQQSVFTMLVETLCREKQEKLRQIENGRKR